MEKKCKRCNETKTEECFYLNKKTLKRANICIACDKKRLKEYRIKNKDKLSARTKEWQKQNPEKAKKNRDNWARKHKEKVNAKSKRWKDKNKKHSLEYNSAVYASRKHDPMYMLPRNLRTRLYQAIKHNFKSGSAVASLGCSIKSFKKYMESKFYDNKKTKMKMSWDNYGKNGWHIDHIIPLASFDLSDASQLAIACHYTNLQPLWAEENFKKGNRVEEIKNV